MTCSHTIGCLVVFTLWDIGIYVHFTCLLTRLWHHKFWNCSFLSDEAVFFSIPKKSRQKCKYIENKNSFQDEIKSIFSHFDGAFIEADGTAPDPKSVYVEYSSFLTLPHLLDCLIRTSNAMSILLLL